jgi:hypothetical protein
MQILAPQREQVLLLTAVQPVTWHSGGLRMALITSSIRVLFIVSELCQILPLPTAHSRVSAELEEG